MLDAARVRRRRGEEDRAGDERAHARHGGRATVQGQTGQGHRERRLRQHEAQVGSIDRARRPPGDRPARSTRSLDGLDRLPEVAVLRRDAPGRQDLDEGRPRRRRAKTKGIDFGSLIVAGSRRSSSRSSQAAGDVGEGRRRDDRRRRHHALPRARSTSRRCRRARRSRRTTDAEVRAGRRLDRQGRRLRPSPDDVVRVRTSAASSRIAD